MLDTVVFIRLSFGHCDVIFPYKEIHSLSGHCHLTLPYEDFQSFFGYCSGIIPYTEPLSFFGTFVQEETVFGFQIHLFGKRLINEMAPIMLQVFPSF